MTGMTMTASEKLKSDTLKRELLVSLQSQQQDFTQVLDQFFKADEHAKTDYIELTQAVINSVDQILEDKDYESSLFLRNTLKPLKEMRSEATALLQQLDEQNELARQQAEFVLTEDMVPVYVLVFQSQGYDLDKWAQLLRSLGRYVLGRPIYGDEANVQSVIRSRQSQDQEGYVKVAVLRSAIEAGATLSVRKDRSGNQLVSLPAGAVSAKNIIEFVQGKNKYRYIKGELIDESKSTIK